MVIVSYPIGKLLRLILDCSQKELNIPANKKKWKLEFVVKRPHPPAAATGPMGSLAQPCNPALCRCPDIDPTKHTTNINTLLTKRGLREH